MVSVVDNDSFLHNELKMIRLHAVVGIIFGLCLLGGRLHCHKVQIGQCNHKQVHTTGCAVLCSADYTAAGMHAQANCYNVYSSDLWACHAPQLHAMSFNLDSRQATCMTMWVDVWQAK